MRGSVTGNTPRVFVESGQRYGRLTVVGGDVRIGVSPSKPAGWRAVMCVCDCGWVVAAQVSGLVSGQKKSCGCLKREAVAYILPFRKDWADSHHLSGHPLYEIWYQMLRRCENPKSPNYKRYGGRGIRVCEPWHDVAAFIADIEREIGPRPDGRTPGGMPVYTLDRIDNDGDYRPGNVQWSTAKEQQANRRPYKLRSEA